MRTEKKESDSSQKPLASCKTPLLWLLAGAGLLALFWLARGNRASMNWAVAHIAQPWKNFWSGVMDICPYSVGELICAVLVIWLVMGIGWTIWQALHGKHVLLQRLCGLAAALVWIYVGVCTFWGVHYYADSFEEKAGMKVEPVSAAQLQATMDWFAQGVQDSASQVPRDENDCFAMEKTDILRSVDKLYDGILQEYPFLQAPNRQAKRAVFSRGMSWCGFTGYLFPYTGESTLNMDCPAVYLPLTIAHEFSHQRGVAPEQEANFVGIAACITSSEPAFVYSGYLYGWMCVSNALYEVNPEAYAASFAALPPGAQADLRANNAYWAAFQGQVKETVQSGYEDFLQSYGQELGLKSYGACVDLLVARYCPL